MSTALNSSQGCFRISSATGDFETQDGDPVLPFGVNYWPASCGVEMWPQWPAAEIRADLDLVQRLGLNCVRFFLRWQDFEPHAGAYDETQFTHLAGLLQWHEDRGLLAHPALFVGYMSGGIFWPSWFDGRNPFSDPNLRKHAVAFAQKAAAVCSRFPRTVLALDLGNELGCLPECAAASPAAVKSWCADISAAVKRSFPGALVVSGSEQTQVNMDVGWRFGAQPGCDFYSMHTYPVSAWHSLAFDGMTDPLGQSLLPFYVKCARAFGPVVVQEFGTLLTRGVDECDAYLRAVLPACRAAGANGFLWWCLRDITFDGHPYDKFAFESQLGLVDARGEVKPALRYFLEFARQLRTGETFGINASTTPRAALYWPREYYARDNPRNPGNEPGVLSRQLAIAHYALTATGNLARVVSDLNQLAPDEALAVTGAKLTASETADLLAWVESGGRLLFHGPDALTWGEAMIRLLGAEPLDFRAPNPRRMQWDDTAWTFAHFPREIRLNVRLTQAQTLATDDLGEPFLFRHDLGCGRVIACLAEVDREFAAHSTERREHARWLRWYHSLFKALRA